MFLLLTLNTTCSSVYIVNVQHVIAGCASTAAHHRGVLRTLPNIYDRAFMRKQLIAFDCFLFSTEMLFTIYRKNPSQMFNRDLNTPLHRSFREWLH